MRGIHSHARANPERAAVVEPDGSVTTFGSLSRDVNRLSQAFLAEGLQREAVVASLQPNTARHLLVELATTQLPMHFTPINWKLAVPEIAHVLADSGADIFAVDGERLGDGMAAAALAGIGPERVIVSGTPGVQGEGSRSLADFIDGHADTLPENSEAGQRMLYTSGTTGHPKGVRRPLSGRTVEEAIAALDYRAGVYGMDHPDGVHLATGPLYHSAPGAYATHSLHLGHTVVILGKFDPIVALGAIERHGVTTAYMVPTMFTRMLALDDSERLGFDVSSLRSIVHTAAPCPRHVKHAMIEWLGPILYEVYGGTEGSATVVDSNEWLQRPGTVGRARQGVDIAIVGENGREQPANEPGAIYIRNPAMKFSYFGDASKTAEAFRGDYFTVGDIGYLDDDGYLFLCDRIADVIISGGVNIYPAEVEAALVQHPAILDAAVIGVPDDEWGEQVRAFVVPALGAGVDDLESDLAAFMRERVAAFKVPRSFVFLDELPRSDAGKILRRELRDAAWTAAGRRL